MSDEQFVHENPGLAAEYLRLRSQGNSPNMAAILASRHPPGFSDVDRQIARNPLVGKALKTSDKDPWKPKSRGDIEKRVETLRKSGKTIERMGEASNEGAQKAATEHLKKEINGIRLNQQAVRERCSPKRQSD